MTLLDAEHLSVARGGRRILGGVDLAVCPGEVVGVLGANGAGKTSLLRVLTGIDPPAEGRISFRGQAISTFSRRARAREIAFLPQPPEAAWPITVEHLVSLARLPFAGPFGHNTAADRAAVDAAIVGAELSALRRRAITTLSAGEAARAYLARAIAGGPRIIVADEPTANLDPAHQLTAMRLLRRVAADGGAVVMAQHDLPLASRFCDRLLLIGDGRVLGLGAPAEVLTPANLALAFGIVARYPANGDNDFFALPWSLVADASPANIVST